MVQSFIYKQDMAQLMIGSLKKLLTQVYFLPAFALIW